MSAEDRAAGPAGETGGREETGSLTLAPAADEVLTEVLGLTHNPVSTTHNVYSAV